MPADYAEAFYLCTEGLVDELRHHGMLSARVCGHDGLLLDDEDTRRLRDLLRSAR